MPTADTSSHPGVDFLRAICFSSSIDISVLLRVLRFHVIAAQQLVATSSRAQARASNSQPASRVQILSGHYNTAVRVSLSLLLRESEMFDLGSVPYKDSDELCMAWGLSAHTRSVQKGSLRYPALFDFAAVLHNEMDVIAARNNHENGPQMGVRWFMRPPTSEGYMSKLICQRPSSIDRRDKRLGNGQARSRRHRIKRAVGPIRPRSFGVHANYLDALNASRVRIHRQKPKALGLKFSCGFTRHLFHQASPASGYPPLGGGAVTAQAQAGTRSFDPPR